LNNGLAFGGADFFAVDGELNQIHKNPKIGVLELWSMGVLFYKPLLQYSIIPFFLPCSAFA
jgi:hypothetical protein